MTTTLLRGAAFADGRSAALQRDVALLMRDGIIAYLGPSDSAPEARGSTVVDAAGATIVPGLVDCHAHFTGLGGANWIARFQDPPDELLARGPDAARALTRMGILTARDVGAPDRLNLRLRDELAHETLAPLIVAAGTWIARRDRYVPFAVQVDSAEALRAAALAEIDEGADWAKVAVDAGPGGEEATFSVDELRPAVEAVHARGHKIAAHASGAGARVAAAAGVDSIEHGFGVDDDTAGLMSTQTTLVTTLSVPASVLGFADTVGGRWVEQREQRAASQDRAFEAVRAAKRHHVRIATGSDFGGGSVRPGHLAWEIEQLVRAGLEPHEALGAATWAGGELLGLEQAGVLRQGGPANVLLVHGDPLSEPAALWRVWRVYRNGERIA